MAGIERGEGGMKIGGLVQLALLLGGARFLEYSQVSPTHPTYLLATKTTEKSATNQPI